MSLLLRWENKCLVINVFIQHGLYQLLCFLSGHTNFTQVSGLVVSFYYLKIKYNKPTESKRVKRNGNLQKHRCTWTSTEWVNVVYGYLPCPSTLQANNIITVFLSADSWLIFDHSCSASLLQHSCHGSTGRIPACSDITPCHHIDSAFPVCRPSCFISICKYSTTRFGHT